MVVLRLPLCSMANVDTISAADMPSASGRAAAEKVNTASSALTSSPALV